MKLFHTHSFCQFFLFFLKQKMCFLILNGGAHRGEIFNKGKEIKINNLQLFLCPVPSLWHACHEPKGTNKDNS